MCCLFGMIDYGHNFNGRQKAKILSALGRQAESRGTDATGYAYNSRGKLRIYKKPLPARKMKLFLPDDAAVVMGHTRMTTQGSEKRNYNNHPFEGRAGGEKFALAHNGVLYNDCRLRRAHRLPKTHIETDSYVAVQLIEKRKVLGMSNLKYMAEEVLGSFVFTVLDEKDNLYIVKGSNPICLYHYPKSGFYLYASTEDILTKAIRAIGLSAEEPIQKDLITGDIIKIGPDGRITCGGFDASTCQTWHYYPYLSGYRPIPPVQRTMTDLEQTYVEELKAVAGAYGYAPEQIDRLLAEGWDTDEIEEFLYEGEI